MRYLALTALSAALLRLLNQPALAYNAPEVPGNGPYATAQAKWNPTAIDQGIAGFVGPSGDGNCLDGYPDNYINPIFKAWATDVTTYSPSDVVGPYSMNGIGSQFGDPTKSLGPVTGDNFHIVSLGDRSADEVAADVAPGTLTVHFAEPIRNDRGADFAVFENGFISAGGAGVAGQIFAELAYCEVSSDGVSFARFPSVSLTADRVGAYGTVDPTKVYNLVGKHVNAYGSSWGTPFDLCDLADDPLVQDGTIDLANINYVRLVDIAGDGSQSDSQGHPIYDAWVTWGSGGADIEAVGVIRHLGETQTAAAGSGSLGWGWNCPEGSLRIEYEGLNQPATFLAEAYTGNALQALSGIGTVLNAWTIDAPDASFATNGGIRLFAYFNPRTFYGDPANLRLMRWNAVAWQSLNVRTVDMDNLLLQSDTIADLATFAVIDVSLTGDINDDGHVNVADLQMLVAAWSSTGGPPADGNWNQAADINSDNYVNVGDLQQLVAQWGRSSQ